MTDLSVEERTIIALLRHAFPKLAIHHAGTKAPEIAGDDPEVEGLLRATISFLSGTTRKS